SPLDDLARELSALLAEPRGPLSAKFGLVLDAAPFVLADVGADLRIEVDGESAVLRVGGTREGALVLGACSRVSLLGHVRALLDIIAREGERAATLVRTRSHLFTGLPLDRAAPLPAAARSSLLGPDGAAFCVGVLFGAAR